MKRYLTLFFVTGLSIGSIAQSVSEYSLDFNNVNSVVNDGGVFFNKPQTGISGFEVPKGSNLTALYAMGFWFGGRDINGQLKLSAQRYENLEDQFKGPLTNNGAALPPVPGTWSDAIFPVTKSEIDNHIANFANAGYVMPSNIANWPAHGDVAMNEDPYLAPFVDTDGDGLYDPTLGDYPCIRGDNAAYVIMNDKGGLHTASGGDPIGIEMHYLFYEYTGIPELEHTTFVNLKLINRGTQLLYDFKLSVFLDGDVGNYADDYFGSDSTRNLMYFYNGDNFDEAGIDTDGYASAPPATGVVLLSDDFAEIGAFGSIANAAAEFWNLMNGRDISGAPWVNAVSGNPTSYMFASDPASTTETDSEVAQSNLPGDRRGVANIDMGPLLAFSEQSFDFAFIYNRENIDNVDNASGLLNVADVVQDYFDNSITGDCIDTQDQLGVDELSEVKFSIFPNPSNGSFTLSIGTDFSDASIEMYDLSGRQVIRSKELTSKETQINVDQPEGIYLLHISIDGRESVKRIILN